MKNLLPLLFSILSYCCFAQDTVNLTVVGTLDSILTEPSGLAVHFNTNSGHFEYWAHNDKGNTDSIFSFQIDDLANMTRIMDVNVPWVDWEDMAKDDSGHIYIGDFGNFNGPDELQVVKIPDPNTFSGSPIAEIIKYEYPANGYWDAEAMIHFNDSLYIFIKRVSNAANPLLEEGVTYCLRIPDVPHPNGDAYIAEPFASFQTKLPGDSDPNTYRVAGAAISPDKKKLVLNTYERIWIFSCFEGNDFFGATATYVQFPLRQIEGIAFINNHEIMMTKEGVLNTSNHPQVYYLDLYPWIDGSCVDCQKVHNGDFGNGTYGWTQFLFGGAEATFSNNNGEAVVDIQTLGTSQWHINIRHKSIPLEQNKQYRISYRAYADDNRMISVIANNRSGSQTYAYVQQNITTVPTYYSHDFTMAEPTNYNSYFSFNVGNFFAHKVYFDDIRLEELDCICPDTRYFIQPIDNTIQHFETSNMIIGLNKINGTDIIYDAGNGIDLNPGFEVAQGATFEAYIDGCDGN